MKISHVPWLTLLSGTILLGLLTLLTYNQASQAQTGYQAYVWEKPWVVSVEPSSNQQAIQTELEIEIQKLLDFCCTNRTTPRHLGPLSLGRIPPPRAPPATFPAGKRVVPEYPLRLADQSGWNFPEWCCVLSG